jgi:hypothetical protein
MRLVPSSLYLVEVLRGSVDDRVAFVQNFIR